MTTARAIRVVGLAMVMLGVVLAAGAAAYLATRRDPGPGPLTAAQAAAYSPISAHGSSTSNSAGSNSTGSNSTASPQPVHKPKPLRPTLLTKVPATAISDGTAHVAVRLSWRPAPGTPRPTFSPAVAGTWSDLYDYEVFQPASTFEPCTTYKLTIPAGTVATDHRPLATSSTLSLTVACPSVTGLQQALARLGYLPYHFVSQYGIPYIRGALSRELAAKHAFDPPHGALVASHLDVPPLEYGQLDPTTEGALEIFQSDHDLTPNGQPDAATWASILGAEMLGHRAPLPYTWVTVSEDIPETLEVHRGAQILVTTPANTGVPGAATAQGVFPIFARYVTTEMIGTDVDGTKYDVPDVPWVNYFNGGDAVHGYPRASYGFPQSNGCVELPIGTAETVFNLLQIGDIVYVT